MANINKNEIGYNENTTANAQMVQLVRRYASPLDISEVFTSIEFAEAYAKSDPISYAGQKISVAGEGLKSEVYKITSGGTLIRLVDEEDLAKISGEMGNFATKDDVVSAITESKSYVDTTLEVYAKKSYVDEVLADLEGGNITLEGYATIEAVISADSASLASAKTYTDTKITEVQDSLNWIPVEGDTEKHTVKHWKGSRANYEFLLKNNAIDDWTRYVVVDEINGEKVTVEYYGNNQVAELTGQLLPVNSIISSISEITPAPFDRYLVGADGSGYRVYECVFDSDNILKWYIKSFDYRYGVRVKDKGLKNYVYVNGKLITYDDVDCGEF